MAINITNIGIKTKLLVKVVFMKYNINNNKISKATHKIQIDNIKYNST